MSELRYNRVFKKGLAAILFCVLLFGSIVAFFIASKVQYDRLVANMKPLDATIVDIDLDVNVRRPDEQKIYIEYEVDGRVYTRELKTDTAISFEAGTGARYSVGDKVPIFYDPLNPKVIASPRSMSVGYFYLLFALFSLSVVLFCLWCIIKKRRSFLVTREEYDKEGEELKKSRLAEKQRKKRLRAERKKKNVKARKSIKKVLKSILIIIASIIGSFLLFVFFAGLLTAL